MKIDFHQPKSCQVLFSLGPCGTAIRKKITKSWRRAALSLILPAVSLPALADETPSRPRPLAAMVGFESATGGDTMGGLLINGKDAGDVKAGSGMHFYLGMLYRPMSVFEVRLTAGYQLDRSPTSGGTVYMDRYPVEFTPTACYGNHRFGAGLTYHTNIKLHGNDFGQDDIRFKNSLGYTIEYGYKLAPFLFLGLRYVRLSYEIENAGVTLNGERTVNANHMGINLYYQF